MKYRKLPVIIEAEVYRRGLEDGFECHAYEQWDRSKCNFDCGNGKSYRDQCYSEGRSRPYIDTLEGKHYISEGDFIITGVKGERYPCKPEIFHMTYEEVKE